jgi:rare lipoprotein A
MLFLTAPVQASLEKFVARPWAGPYVTTVKTWMIASWYGQKFQGRMTSSGELFDLNKLTAAHKTLPLGSMVKLTALSTGKSVVVRINDRGPWVKGRDFDLSEAAAMALGIHESGVATVEATLAESDYAVMIGARKNSE